MSNIINIKRLEEDGEYIIGVCDSCGNEGICYDVGMFICKKCCIKSNDYNLKIGNTTLI